MKNDFEYNCSKIDKILRPIWFWLEETRMWCKLYELKTKEDIYSWNYNIFHDDEEWEYERESIEVFFHEIETLIEIFKEDLEESHSIEWDYKDNIQHMIDMFEAILVFVESRIS